MNGNLASRSDPSRTFLPPNPTSPVRRRILAKSPKTKTEVQERKKEEHPPCPLFLGESGKQFTQELTILPFSDYIVFSGTVCINIFLPEELKYK